METEYRVVCQDLPYGVKGFIVYDCDGYPTIVLNAHYSYDTNRHSFDHELDHLLRDDVHNALPLCVVEAS